MTTSTTPLSVYPLRIVLRGISPLIWRRVLVPSSITLAHLQTILQILFAWRDEPLHRCHIHGREYGSSGANTYPV
jgi:Plasmid pRiA4b ORF-3-like protein